MALSKHYQGETKNQGGKANRSKVTPTLKDRARLESRGSHSFSHAFNILLCFVNIKTHI